MRALRDFILPAALALVLVPLARAGDDDKKASDKKGDEQTIRGVVAEVTILGETDIDYATRKAVTAEATYLTIIGHPANHEAMHKDGDKAHATASADKDKDKDKDKEVKRTANTSEKDQSSADRPRHRMNVYVVAVSPRTEVCECKETGKSGSESVKEEKCDLSKLEIGDRVEVSFSSKEMAGKSGEKAQAHPANQKHGRHRTYFGTANSIKIMADHMEGEHSASAEHEARK